MADAALVGGSPKIPCHLAYLSTFAFTSITCDRMSAKSINKDFVGELGSENFHFNQKILSWKGKGRARVAKIGSSWHICLPQLLEPYVPKTINRYFVGEP
jgi:hypothetical protein